MIQGVAETYIVRLEQEENRIGGCSSQSEGWEYLACDDAFIRESLDRQGWFGVTPLWATDHLEKVTDDNETLWRMETTNNTKYENGKLFPTIEDIMYGLTPNNCTHPCLQTKVELRHKFSAGFMGNVRLIFLF